MRKPPAMIRRAVKPTQRFLVLALSLSLLGGAAIVGCGESEDPADTSEAPADTAAPEDVPGDADPEDKRVIGAWVDALRSGDVDEAASFFAIPSVAENGPILVRIRSKADAIAFNESLPCGAEMIRAEGQGDFTTATFRLTERPGAGRCGSGSGETASTAFVIRDGKIVEWRRVLEAPPTPGQSA
jgi:limonene-1,2-epoxide hydrolase